MMGRTKGAPRNGSTVVCQHKFPFPEGEALLEKCFAFPESIQGSEIHEEQGWDAKPVAVAALGSWEELEKHLGKQERSSAGEPGGISVGNVRNSEIHYSTTNSCSCLAVGTHQHREDRSFPSQIPQKKTKPLLYNPSGTEAFVIYNFPCIPSPHLVKYSLTPPQVRHKPRVFPYLTGPLIPAPSF